MDAFARAAVSEREDAFAETATQMGVDPIIAEKDFWVCWTLRRLFTLCDPKVNLIFKGGTSLSKAYRAIERFSEDVDVSIDRHDLGFVSDRDPAGDGVGSNERKRLLKELSAVAEAFVRERLQPSLRTAFADALGHDNFALDVDRDPQTLLFAYPRAAAGERAGGYITPTVRLEFGARSDHAPAEERTIVPYVHEVFPGLLDDAETVVKVLAVERTFWEKATILHQIAHQPDDKPIRDRLSRHYMDLAKLAASEFRERALSRLDLLEEVAEHKATFFPQASARYDIARPGTLRLVPGETAEKKLRADYRGMDEMTFGTTPSFDAILATLKDLEAEINATVG